MKQVEAGAYSIALQVKGLTKRYPAFSLKQVSFSLARGRIIGFIGRNGAGKSTTLKSIMGFLHTNGGEITFFENPDAPTEQILQRIGFVAGGVNFYPNKKLAQITSVTKHFYKHWDKEAYNRYLERFQLDERKTPAQLSAGMQVKYAIALALSHGAELLILDEPTSGLDPVSREDLLELFLALSKEGKTILFSTHITSDLDRCADDIIYIRGGEICAENSIEEFKNAYRVVTYSRSALSDRRRACLIGERLGRIENQALVRAEDATLFEPAAVAAATLEDVMVHLEKEEK